MVSASKSAIFYMIALSVMLLLPTIMIKFIDPAPRAKWENRSLTEMPDFREIPTQPKKTFQALDDYIDDHIGGSFEIIKFRRKFYFDVFNATGDTYMVGKNKGALFLTAPFRDKDRGNPFQWWENVCVKMQSPGYQRTYIKRVAAAQARLSSGGADVVFASVPSTPVLIPEQFPLSTPKEFREACAKISVKDNHIKDLNNVMPDTRFFYPLGVFQEKAKDPYFYPNSAYHWQGESTWVFIEEFAKQNNIPLPAEWPSEPCEYRDVEWDIGKLIGVGDTVKGCDRNLSDLGISIDNAYMYPLSEKARKENPKKTAIKVVKMTNPHATNDKTAIIITNSFGPAVRQQYAALFKTTYHLRPGIMNTPDIKLVLSESDILNADLVTVVIADFHYPNFLIPFEQEGYAKSAETSTHAEASAIRPPESLNCKGKYTEVAPFSNANWLEGKQRKGNGLMFEGLTNEEFSRAKSIYIAEGDQTHEIVYRKRAGQRYQYFIIKGDTFKDIEFKAVCINFTDQSD